MEQPINQYEEVRRQKLQKLRDLGVDPFGGRVERVQALGGIRALHKPEFGQDGGPVVKAAGRVIGYNDRGKLVFLRLRDSNGELQVAVDKRRVSERDWAVIGLTDLGDQLVFEGRLGATKTGEVTVWAGKKPEVAPEVGAGQSQSGNTGGTPVPSHWITMASKSLLQPPEKWHGLTDVELRYRQRYVDLFTNPDVMRVLKLRSAVVAEIRQYMTGLGYMEVETPMMQPLAGGAAARPFVTHHNALDIDLFLRIAPELYLKRLLVGGFEKVFELNRNFRNEGISPRHNPEFTMLEAYEAYGSWETMADMVEGMICHIAEKLFGGLKIEHKNAEGVVTKTINLTRPWRRVSMETLVAEWLNKTFDLNWEFKRRGLERGNAADDHAAYAVGLKMKAQHQFTVGSMTEASDEAIAAFAVDFAYQRLDKLSPAEQLVELYEKLVEPTLIDPTFVTRVPSVIIPLARKCEDDDFFADVYELAINGQEISPGYSELNDPDVQAENFKHQVGDKEEQQKVDEDFLTALRYGMPPAGGMGMGIDRLVMMLAGAESIRDVILFPLMRPQE